MALSRTSFSRREVAVTMLDLLLLILISSWLEARVLRLSRSVSTVFCTVVHVHLCICTTVAVVYSESTLFFECIETGWCWEALSSRCEWDQGNLSLVLVSRDNLSLFLHLAQWVSGAGSGWRTKG